MPEICRFYGIRIAMFYDEGKHNLPHFHVIYAEYKASIGIGDFALMAGNLPPKALALVVEWASQNKEALIKNWKLAKDGKVLEKIDPLL